jgi:nicotinamidase-related amidase
MPEDKVRKIELPRLDPKEVMLLVVDMQNDFCHPQGARAKAFGGVASRRTSTAAA